ncbi:MAG: hypothetical protein H6618_02005 [Deltaproteobacteria bacterium]|nr:hypothetical protein [Deltaproteobacteria bacterium]
MTTTEGLYLRTGTESPLPEIPQARHFVILKVNGEFFEPHIAEPELPGKGPEPKALKTGGNVKLIEKYKQYKQQRLEKAIARNLKTIRNPKAIREDRTAAIEFFKASDHVEHAVPPLLQRFDFSLEHGINDSREKESAMEGILNFKEEAIPYIIEHIRQTYRVAWPIKALKALANETQVVEALSQCLDYGDISFDQNKINKNYDLLCYLRDYKLNDELSRKLYHFLEQYDERVRFAATETLIEQDEPGIPHRLEAFMKDSSPENTRIRKAVTDCFINKKWKVSDSQAFPEGSLIQGINLNSEGILENRQN